MLDAYRIAAENSKRSSEIGKWYNDQHVRGAVLQHGEWVLVGNLSERGDPQQIHRVIKRIKESPVYRIQSETGDRTFQVLHRNQLLPISDLLVIFEEKDRGVGKMSPRWKCHMQHRETV